MPLKYNDRFCGAKSKQNNNKPCMQPSIKNKQRCRLHGGKSTGPKTVEGREKSRQANLKHGLYTKSAICDKLILRELIKWHKNNIL
jgi:hypothetical protein